jgi:metal-responsive CopG/Arc/MetJ family transcriptional regulator
MARTTITFTMSLPPEMAEELRDTMTREHRTRSELVREALRRYFNAQRADRALIKSIRRGEVR